MAKRQRGSTNQQSVMTSSAKILQLKRRKKKQWLRVSHNMVRDSETGIYYLRKWCKELGRELFESTKVTKKNQAQTIADEKFAEAKKHLPGMKNKRIRIDSLCDSLLEELDELTKTLDQNGFPMRRLSTYKTKDLPYLRPRYEHTEKNPRKGTREQGVIRDLFGSYFVDEIDEIFWQTWVKRTGRKLGRNLDDIAKYLSKVLTYAYEQKYIARKPVIKYQGSSRNSAIAYTDEQIIAFYQNAEPTLKDIILMAAENPLRPHEVQEAQWEMIQFFIHENKEHAVYKIPEWFAKTGEARELRLSPSTTKMLKKRKDDQKDQNKYVFPSPKNPDKPLNKKQISRMWDRMKRKLNITSPIRFHWLRHSFYTKALLIAGEKVQHVSAAGGTSIKTLQKRYLKPNAETTASVSTAVNFSWDGHND